jgi:hypothetical protein
MSLDFCIEYKSRVITFSLGLTEDALPDLFWIMISIANLPIMKIN